jgi:Ca-activated chloride channel family protein
MKIDCQLDYQTILTNQAQPVHAVLKLTADKRTSDRKTPLAFCAVLDRSGSMQGTPLEYAKKACETVARHLGKDDWFTAGSNAANLSGNQTEPISESHPARYRN